ncbi:MAG: aspartate aminotransferase family protein [Phycisphaerales bacterium]|nr:aspartate aminotransferase family protein [Phycisphaerales bacterium]MCI0631894.1 aspartate aminotransferase family protein [Phycisphaerales bacterium]MCI0676749.1 aspartate aminotransferase family protein [Phycisphaerales bacterium]
MPLDIKQLLQSHQGRNYDLHRDHINPVFARVLKTIGFDHVYGKAQGPYLWDNRGNKYLDFMGGWAVLSMGRNHPAIKQALIDFLNEDYPSIVAFDAPLLSGLLAAELKKKTANRLDYVFFTNSGTEGIEAAIKFAKCSTGRPAILFAEKAFHGLSSGSLSLNGEASFRKGFEPLLPECRMIPFNDLAALEQALSKRDVAAFIVEPIQGKGVNIPSPGYLREAAALCRRHGSLFVVDEVQTGVGRTGKFLAIDHEGDVDPDIIVVSKALSGGYVPVGAVLTRRKVWESVFSSMDRAIVHSSTFHQGSLAMVTGLASLKALEEENMMENANRMGKLIIDGINAMKPRFELISDVRGRGLMIGIEFGRPKSLSLRTAWSLIHKMNADLFPQAVVIPLMDDHRVITQVAGHHIDVVKLTPPLNITQEDVRWFLTAFEDVMRKLHQFPGPIWEVMKKLGKHAVTKRPREAVEA